MIESAKHAASLHFLKHGPVRVEGTFRIVDIDGNELEVAEAGKVYLCTCGKSNTKPFCDCSHQEELKLRATD
ncbi:MAG: CDGSH iron-sulfur domain-containing protein [Tenuifilaceae bacterium]